MSLKIHAFPLSPRSFKVLWLANHLGVDYAFQLVDFTKNAQNAPEYVALNPNGRAPLLEHDGYVLWESNAILEYLAALKPDSGLLPQDTRGRLGVCKWLFWESAHWDPACAVFAFERVVKPLVGLGGANNCLHAWARCSMACSRRRGMLRETPYRLRISRSAPPCALPSRRPFLW